MASTNVSNIGQTSCDATISGLSNDFNQTYYDGAGVGFTDLDSEGQSYPPPQIQDWENAPSSGTERSVDFYVSGLSSGTTYTLYGFAQAANGNYYRAGSDTFTTDEPPTPPRPSNWTGFNSCRTGNAYGFYLGYPAPVTASSWNNFTSRINDFRDYKGLSDYNFTTVSSGYTVTDQLLGQAVTAINAMSPPTSPPSGIVSGNEIQEQFYELQQSLNSIP